jgi:HAD superfamily hydrolase (TIGR01662 family)
MYSFTAYGHKNILAAHRNTLEFTKDKELSLNGDCIVGICADFSLNELSRIARKHRMLRMRIEAGKVRDSVDFIANPDFSSDHELVLRLSEFSSERTLGFRAAKSAVMLNRQLIEKLKNPKQKIKITIEPIIKAFILDFDNTVEDFKSAAEFAHKQLAKKLFELYGIYEPTALELLEEVDMEFSIKGIHSSPKTYDRHLWFKELFKKAGLNPTASEINLFVDLYWRFIIEKAEPMPHALSTLKKLKQDYKLAIMTDSDGRGRFKVERAKTTGIFCLADVFMVSDEVKVNKPSTKFYRAILKKLSLSPGECVMVGDKPQVDLELAKQLGMKTVWLRYGKWSEELARETFDYVDFTIKDIRELLNIISLL